MNKVVISGRLGADPDMKGAVLKLRVATNERRKDKDGNWGDHTEWHSVVVFGKRAEALSRLLRKGSRVLVEGKLRTSNWEKDGEKRYKTEIAADDLELLDGREAGGAPRAPATPAPQPQVAWDEDDMPF